MAHAPVGPFHSKDDADRTAKRFGGRVERRGPGTPTMAVNMDTYYIIDDAPERQNMKRGFVQKRNPFEPKQCFNIAYPHMKRKLL